MTVEYTKQNEEISLEDFFALVEGELEHRYEYIV